jgi:hypothetical protein
MHKTPGEKEAILTFFFETRALREKKEARTMPPATRGAVSPWFIGRAQKPVDGESEPNYWWLG